MSIFGDLLKTSIDIVALPVDVVKDTIDVMKGEEPNNVTDRIEQIKEDIEDL